MAPDSLNTCAMGKPDSVMDELIAADLDPNLHFESTHDVRSPRLPAAGAEPHQAISFTCRRAHAASQSVRMAENYAHEVKQPYIPAIPAPEAVLRGGRRGISSQLDPRSWLEVSDIKHRYAKHLRAYFEAWDLLGKPQADFFTWLEVDSYELDSCPRSTLDSDVVYYCEDESERERYCMEIRDGVIVSATTGLPITTGDHGWIFVLRDDVMFGAAKRTKAPRIHHSSFFAGECVDVAGMMVVEAGIITKIFPHSGHYRPRDRHVLFLLQSLEQMHIDLSMLQVDAQHTMKVARAYKREGPRISKKDRPHFMRGDVLLHFLQRKSQWREGLLDELLGHAMLSPRNIPEIEGRPATYSNSPASTVCRIPEFSQSTPVSLRSILDQYSRVTESDCEAWSMSPPSPPPESPEERTLAQQQAEERRDTYIDSLDLATRGSRKHR